MTSGRSVSSEHRNDAMDPGETSPTIVSSTDAHSVIAMHTVKTRPLSPSFPFPTSTAHRVAPPTHISAVTALYSWMRGDTRLTAESSALPIMFPTIMPFTTTPREVAITARMVETANVLKARLTR